MIQRQQTLWLILAAACAILSFIYPFYTGEKMQENMKAFDVLTAGSNFFLLIVTGASALAAAIAIFLFKDRKTQIKLSIAGLVLSVILVILYIMEIKKFLPGGHFALTSVYIAGILVGFVMATRGILKDEKLVKSLNKLR